MSADEQRIRELAHQIWLAEVCPKDQARRHWDMARQLAESEQNALRKQPGPSSPPSG